MKKNQSNIAIFSSIIIGFVLSFIVMNSFSSKEDFEDLALGKATVSHYAKSSNNISVHYSPKTNANDYIDELEITLNVFSDKLEQVMSSVYENPIKRAPNTLCYWGCIRESFHSVHRGSRLFNTGQACLYNARQPFGFTN